MVGVVLGALGTVALWGLVEHTRRRGIRLKWWEWTLVVASISYAGFVAAAVVTLLSEGTPRAALVIGTLTGVPATILGVLLARFVFAPKLVAQTSAPDPSDG